MSTMIDLTVADAREMLYRAPDMIPAVFTSLPDAAELGVDIAAWRPIFEDMLAATFQAIAPHGVVVITATDRRVDGGLESKAGMVLAQAARFGLRVLWHKITVNTHGVSLFRPSYSHLIALGRGKAKAGRPSPDVFDGGSKYYSNSLGRAAISAGLDVIELNGAEVLVDPFVGRGSILGAAADRNIRGVGIDIDPQQIHLALEHLVSLARRVEPDPDLLVGLA